VFDPDAGARKEHSLETPVGEEEKFAALRRLVGKDILKGAPLGDERLDPAKLTGEETVGFLELRRPPALRALMLDEIVDEKDSLQEMTGARSQEAGERLAVVLLF
jgi:hypothetical protein